MKTIYFYNKKWQAHDLGTYTGRLSQIGVENWCYRIAQQLGVERHHIVVQHMVDILVTRLYY